jgi:hypothetical protein
MSKKKKRQMIQIFTFKKKKKERGKRKPPIWWPMEGSKVSGPWNVPCLVALEMNHAWRLTGKHFCLVAKRRFQVWWPLECSMFGCLWKEKGKHPFHLLPLFTPKDFTSTFFSLILRFFFTMVLDHYVTFFLHFP